MTTHIDDWIDDTWSRRKDKGETYAAFFFNLHRLPASHQECFREHIGQFKLFCTFEGKRWRVTGCSRMGDIWLQSDHSKDHGYDTRIFIDHCTQWSDRPYTPPPEHAPNPAQKATP